MQHLATACQYQREQLQIIPYWLFPLYRKTAEVFWTDSPKCVLPLWKGVTENNC